MDIHVIVAEYLIYDSPNTSVHKTKKWTRQHVLQTQYLLQILKCLDSGYCDTNGLDIIEEYRVIMGWPVFSIVEDEWIILFESF